MPSQLVTEMLSFIESVGTLASPDAVLNDLDAITWPSCRAHVVGAALLPLNFGDTGSLVLGKTVFLHASVPEGWWAERIQLLARSPAPVDVAARLALAPFSLTDIMKSLEPIGIDRWAIELNLKYGIRDSFGCPVGGRWIFAYWSPKSMNLEPDQRALLYLGATFATARLQHLAPPYVGRLGKGASLTPRELAVLRSMSLGRRVAEISKEFELGEETVRTHLKKAQAKLGVATPVHAVAQAMRLRLIP